MTQSKVTLGVEKSRREYIWYWDILRISAVVCLVIRHVSTASFDFVEPLGAKWWIFNSYGSLVAWMVPVYLMLSGAFFLEPANHVTLRSLYRRNIFRMLIAFFVWSALYALYNVLSGQDASQPVFVMLLQGHFHLWFLPMIIGIYMLVPAFRLVTTSIKGTVYIFLISLFVSVAAPMMQDLGWFPDESIFTGENNVGFISAHVCFFIAGYLFHKIQLTKKQRIALYLLAIISTATVFIGTWQLTLAQGIHNEDLQSDSNMLTGIQGIALFVFMKEACAKKRFSPEVQGVIRLLSSLTFGVYLVHVMFIALLDRFGFSTLTYNAGWMIPLVLCLVLPLSFGATWLIRKIPFLGKYIT